MRDDPVTIDRRDEERSDCAMDGKIELDGRRLDCVVRDLSFSGARLDVDPATVLPAEFVLLVPVVPGTDQRFRVRLVWRHGGEAGAQFLRAN